MSADWRDGLLDAYKGKRVLVTGHTGFKGSWLAWMLADAGAEVTGYALEPPTHPNLFDICGLRLRIDSRLGDIRDYERLKALFDEKKPEVVFHLAAQPIVRDSYDDPRYTFDVNIMGTVNVLECVRQTDCVQSMLNVTTDKVYRNSDSKSCSELVTHSYVKSFDLPPVSTARAGNVIGGGDFAPHRIIPDCVRAMEQVEQIALRNPHSTRPFQHVLEPLAAYLLIAARQAQDPHLAGWYNVGPDERDCVDTATLADLWCKAWGEPASWYAHPVVGDAKHEAAFLQLDNGKLKETFGWRPVWGIQAAVEKTVEWTRCGFDDGSTDELMSKQIEQFLEG